MSTDNTTLNNTSGGDTIRDLARQSSTVKTQVVQLDLGGAATNAEKLITAGQQTSANSVPVVIASDQSGVPVTGTFFQATQPVSGTVTTTPPSNATTNVTQFAGTNVSTGTGVGGAGIPRVTVSSDSFPATQPVSGTVAATQSGTWNIGSITTLPSIPTGSNVIGSVKVTDGTNTGAVKAASTAAVATDPAQVVAISPNNSVVVTQATAANLNATVTGTITTTPPSNASTNITQFGGTNISTGTGVGGTGIPRVTVSSDSFPATQAVSGTVTANQGTANTAANAWTTKITDGTNVSAVKAASTAAVATDPAQVVAISPNNSVAVTQATAANLNATVTGTVTTSPPSNATTNVTQFGGTNVSTGTGTGGAGIPRVTVSSDSFPATQAVSGTVTANQGTANTAANAWTAKVTDGTNIGAVKAASTAAVATDPAIVVAVSPNNSIVVTQATAANLNVTVTGTVTSNQGTANSAANAWTAKITDGTNVSAVKAASTAAVATDPAQVVAISPNNTVSINGTVTNTPGINAPTELNGQLQRIADNMELLIIQQRITNILLTQLQQAGMDDFESLQKDGLPYIL